MFFVRRDRITVDRSRNSGIVFDCVLQNKARRVATVLSQEYELWIVAQVHAGPAEFLTRLSFDLTSQSTNTLTYRADEGRGLKLIWPFFPSQLQRIEDVRQGKEPCFEIRNRLLVKSQHYKADGALLYEEQFNEESAYESETNAYPIRFKINHAEWTGLLDEIGFTHIILQELALPVFPPEFKRAQDHLKDAWHHHRAGRERPALLSCFNTFECLGFDLTGTPDKARIDVLGLLMTGKEQEKQEKIKALWAAVGNYCHLGRHDKGPPVEISHQDGELALVCATVLLKYLAG
jgi:hypothetical protein